MIKGMITEIKILSYVMIKAVIKEIKINSNITD